MRHVLIIHLPISPPVANRGALILNFLNFRQFNFKLYSIHEYGKHTPCTHFYNFYVSDVMQRYNNDRTFMRASCPMHFHLWLEVMIVVSNKMATVFVS